MNKQFYDLVLNDKITWEELHKLLTTFNTALGKCQKELQPIGKHTSAYNFKYAKYEEIRAATKDILSNNGLTIEQWKGGNHEQPYLYTRIKHDCGYEETYQTPMILKISQNSKMQPEQEDGKSISYYKRYMYCSILGIATQEADIDDQ